MKVSCLLLSVFLALASGHYVNEEPQIRHEEPSENHVRSHHKENQGGPRVHSNNVHDEAGPRVHHHHEGPHPKQENQGPRKYPDEGGAPRAHHQNEGPPRPKQEEETTTKQNLRQGGNPKHHQGPRSTQSVNVVIVGSGMAGLSAAYDLKKAGWTVKILEAKERHGGRIYKDTKTFNMPIDIGAEWVHLEAAAQEGVTGGFTDHNKLLGAITGTTQNQSCKKDPEEIFTWDKIAKTNAKSPSYSQDWRWKDSTWYDFMKNEIMGKHGVENDIMLNCPVDYIWYGDSTSGVTVYCQKSGTEHVFEASYVIVTVPMNILSASLNPGPKPTGSITFDPMEPLATYAAQAKRFKMGPGIKVWLEFTQKFWKGLQALKDIETTNNIEGGNSADTWGARVYFDEMWGHTTSTKHVIGMFAHGTGTAAAYKTKSNTVIIDEILAELSAIYGVTAKDLYTGTSYVQHWTNEPYIETGYTQWAPTDAMTKFQYPVKDVVYFAGEAIPPDAEDWGYAHAAAQSGKAAAKYIIASGRRRRDRRDRD